MVEYDISLVKCAFGLVDHARGRAGCFIFMVEPVILPDKCFKLASMCNIGLVEYDNVVVECFIFLVEPVILPDECIKLTSMYDIALVDHARGRAGCFIFLEDYASGRRARGRRGQVALF